MVVLAPARDIGPRHREILAAADLERPGQARVWNRAGMWKMRAHAVRRIRATRAVRGTRSQRQRDGYPTTKRGGVSPQATPVSNRLPCQPASRADRVCWG